MAIRTFTIPQPIISQPNCEWFVVRYRKTQRTVSSAWTILGNIAANTFDIDLENNTVYEIEAIHHCCDGSDSLPTVVQFNTANNNPTIYVCMTQTLVSDTCATTPGSCRNCEVTKEIKFKFFSDANANNQLALTSSNWKIKLQKNVNNSNQTIELIDTYAGYTEISVGNRVTYKETCIGGISSSENTVYSVIDGTNEIYPYKVVSCISNNPTLTQILNTYSGAIRTQKFKVGNDILPGNKFQLGVYSVVKTVIAVTGDTPTSIAQKLAAAINSTTSAQWNQFGTAPTSASGFPPVASSSGSEVTITLNYQNSFFGAAYQN